MQKKLVGKNASGSAKKRSESINLISLTPGQADLAMWNNARLPFTDVENFMRIFGYCADQDFQVRCSDEIFKYRRLVLSGTLRMLQKNVHGIKTLSQLKPKQLPKILALWQPQGLNGDANHTTEVTKQLNVLHWFWRLHGIRSGILPKHRSAQARPRTNSTTGTNQEEAKTSG